MSQNKNKKYTFKEFIAISGMGYNPKYINNENLEWAEEFINDIPRLMKEESHYGDCIKLPCTCDYCVLQNYLEDYEEYCLHEKEFWKKYNKKVWKNFENIVKRAKG